MVFIVYSGVNANGIRQSLGKAEYSYYFLIRAFQPMLEKMGEVISVSNPEQEVDAVYQRCQQRGEPCVFLCFSPPNIAPVGLRCPTLCVFAWEFNTIPSASWDDNPNNDWRRVFARHGAAISSSSHSARVVKEAMGSDFPVAGLPAPIWDDFAALRAQPRQTGVISSVRLSVQGFVYDSAQTDFVINNLIPSVFPPATVATPAPEPATEAQAAVEPVVSAQPVQSFEFSGVVYTSVFNPLDGRKAYYDIVTAFCWAFREVEDAVLLLKMTHTDPDSYRHNINHMLHQLAPFKCRVIAFNGFLEAQDYQEMVRSTSYYVNASYCEGLCLPLVEFLSAGVPAVAPDHSAMEDYITPELAFIIESSIEPNVWPNDTRELYTTTRYRNDWGSLVRAYRQSYEIAVQDETRYVAMSTAAMAGMQEFCSQERVQQRLNEFLGGLIELEGGERG